MQEWNELKKFNLIPVLKRKLKLILSKKVILYCLIG